MKKYICESCGFRTMRKFRFDDHIVQCKYQPPNKIFISIGGNCVTKHIIKTYIQDIPTFPFDWVTTIVTIDPIIRILSCGKINEILNRSNINVTDDSKSDGKIVTIKNIPSIKYIHDLGEDATSDDIDLFVKKYIRRHNRLLEVIKNKICEKIFIRYEQTHILKIKDLIHSIKNIGSNFRIIYLIDNEDCTFDYIETVVDSISVLKINLRNYMISEEDYTKWKMPWVDWEKVTNLIKDLCDFCK
jgi:hypothetical protein